MLPRTLAEIMSMGRDALHAIVRVYQAALGLSSWEITARWVEPADADTPGEVVAGSCLPNPRYQRAEIEVAWPPVGDLEETVAHEMVHCRTAKLAYQAGGWDPESWARDEWEEIAEQTARGMVALRRDGERNPVVLARVFRSTVAALRRDRMDPVKLAELAMKAGEMAAREDVPEDVRGLLSEFVAALAGGGGEVTEEPPMATDPEDPDQQPAMEEEVPAYMRALVASVADVKATVARLASPPAQTGAQHTPAVADGLAEQRRISVETYLMTRPGLLSAEAQRELVSRGDMQLARMWVAEAQRRAADRGNVKPPNVEKPAVQLNDIQRAAARRHKISDDKYAAQLQRQAGQQKVLGRGAK